MTSKSKNAYLDTLNGIDWWNFTVGLGKAIYHPAVEISHGITSKSLPWSKCLLFGTAFNLITTFGLDEWLLEKVHLSILYPHSPTWYFAYWILGALAGFFIWGFYQSLLRNQMTSRLAQIFVNAGLKSPMGRLPSFVFDKPLDEYNRVMRLTKASFPVGEFEKSRPSLESQMQVTIAKIEDHLAKGTIDIIYTHSPMPSSFKIADYSKIPLDTFMIGKSRLKEVFVSLLEIPHLLVGGSSHGGKSTFLRQLITTLYIRNPTYTFNLVDLKEGLEFQVFEGLPRIEVITTLNQTILLMDEMEACLKKRMELLRLNKCKDIQAYLTKPKEERVAPEKPIEDGDLDRKVLVIDEVAQMFLVGGSVKSSEIQEAQRILSLLTAQGRAAGIHVIVATQKPDVRALDSQIKANLTGKLCFAMPNIASSMTVLGNGRAVELPVGKGRAFWQSGSELLEVQIPLVEISDVNRLLHKDTETTKGDLLNEAKTNSQPQA